jgi:hypothetical protein
MAAEIMRIQYNFSATQARLPPMKDAEARLRKSENLAGKASRPKPNHKERADFGTFGMEHSIFW